jgi:radical SAM enzyme (TIGR01210 family)
MDICTRYRNNVIQICIPTTGCHLGNCIFCNYGCSSLLPISNLKQQLIDILNFLPKNISVAVIDGVGSIWDFNEVPKKYLIEICKLLNSCEQLKTIIFETHYKTINEDICLLVKKLLPQKELEVELGLETINQENQKNIRKIINLDELKQKMVILKKYNFLVEANILFGIPFLSKEDRLIDCINTIKWALNNGFFMCTIFPCNLKLGTDLYDIYLRGEYELVSHIEILNLLTKLSNDEITKIGFSWVGDWSQVENGKIINKKPLLCEKQSLLSTSDYNTIQKLCNDFYNNFGSCKKIAKEKKNIVYSYQSNINKILENY